MEVTKHEPCDCDYCKQITSLVTEIGEVIDGYSIGDIVTAFAHILSGIGENVTPDSRQFAAEFYTVMTAMMEDNTDGHCTYN